MHEADALCGGLPALAEASIDGEVAQLLPSAAVPDLSSLGLPARELSKMQARRERLQHQFELELAREGRGETGALSEFEIVCGACDAPATRGGVKLLTAKFEAARAELLQVERLEIEAFSALHRWGTA